MSGLCFDSPNAAKDRHGWHGSPIPDTDGRHEPSGTDDMQTETKEARPLARQAFVQRRSRPQDRRLRSKTPPGTSGGSVLGPRTKELASRGPRNLRSKGTLTPKKETLPVGRRFRPWLTQARDRLHETTSGELRISPQRRCTSHVDRGPGTTLCLHVPTTQPV